MSHYAFMAPIKSGKAAAWKQYVQEMTTSRKDEMRASRKKLGLEKEEVWLQHTPNGDFAVVYIEAKNPGEVMQKMMTSEDPFDRWFREKVLIEVHGMDPSAPPPPPNEEILH
ncbi:hypothetical protein [Devosia sp.]|uniref:hypothetical protein n=1 Tax=Devosia sp. TaxID=1871048 RepID=UPI002FC895DF